MLLKENGLLNINIVVMKIAFNVGEFLVGFLTMKIILNVKRLYYIHSRSGHRNSRHFSKSLINIYYFMII